MLTYSRYFYFYLDLIFLIKIISQKGVSLLNLNNEEDAITTLDLALELNADSFDAYNYKGIAYHNLKNYEEAIRMFDNAIQINPKFVDAYCFKGSNFLLHLLFIKIVLTSVCIINKAFHYIT